MQQPILPKSPLEEPEEIVTTDDRIIGRALRVSLAGLFILTVATVGVVWWLKRKPAPPPSKLTSFSAPVVPTRPQAEIPEARFTDITGPAGIRCRHHNGAYGEKLLPETMGGGVAFFDFNNDGHQDLLFINSTDWPWHPGKEPAAPSLALYRNNGRGEFSDVTAGSGLDLRCYGMGAAMGDYDNDGLADVFVTALGGNHLFHNEGEGKFREVTAEAGVGGKAEDWGSCAAWIDFDRDGKLDLFAGNYVKWSREIDAEVGYKIDGRTRAYGQPMNFGGTFPYLYRNDGGGKFSDVTAASGLQMKNPATGVAAAKTLGVAPADLDGDGWIDLVVANDTVQNFVFHNQRNGTFKEIGAATGIAFDSYGNTRGAMGIDTGRYRADGRLAVGIGNFANEMTALYVAQNQPLLFTDEAIPEGVGPASRLLLKFGLFFFDYDLDGRLDLLTANGHLDEAITKIQQSQTYAQPAQLFWNAGERGSGSFVAVPPTKAGSDLFKPMVGRGSAFADLDGDGDLDVVITQIGGPPLLLRNDQALGHRWIRLKLVGTKSNRDAIGAWIRVRTGNEQLWRQVMPTRSYFSQSELPVTIGLASAQQADEVEITWPSGVVQKVDSIALNGLTVVTETP
jgi:hypothetical protein